jgi:hypothetical protein
LKNNKNDYSSSQKNLHGIRASCSFSISFFLLMMSYKSAMTDAQRNPTDSSGTSETIQPNPTILPNPTIPPTFVSADSYPQNSAPYLMATKLNGHNYLEWAQSIKLAIDGRGKIGHLTGEISKPAAGDPNKKKMAVRKFSCYCLAHQFNGTCHWKTSPISSHC